MFAKMSKVYFASDFHLGSPDYSSSLEREKKVIKWLSQIQDDAESIFLVGDIFDFWYEYKTVVPKNYTRLLGKIAELTDKGIKIYFFKGNHDMWTFDYLSSEVGVEIVDEEWIGVLQGKKVFVHHGDGLGPGDRTYKFIRSVFRSSWAIWLFHRIHPNFGIGLAQFLSRKSRAKNMEVDKLDIPFEHEYQVQFVSKYQEVNPCDFYIFGHRHKPRDVRLNENARFINLGDWVNHFTYAVLYQGQLELKTYNHSAD